MRANIWAQAQGEPRSKSRERGSDHKWVQHLCGK